MTARAGDEGEVIGQQSGNCRKKGGNVATFSRKEFLASQVEARDAVDVEVTERPAVRVVVEERDVVDVEVEVHDVVDVEVEVHDVPRERRS